MNKERPETTLFMLISLDGKISPGDEDNLDMDKDYPKIKGVKEGLNQYYELQNMTDLHSLNTGRVMEKIGVNTKNCPINCPIVSFIILDNTHLTKEGVQNLINNTKKLYLVTSNKNHPAFELEKEDKLEIIFYKKEINFEDLFKKFKKDYKIDRITIQSGGTLNSIFLRKNLIDHLSLVIAPALIGGKDTPTLIDGESLHTEKDLSKIKTFKLKECKILKDSYLHLRYDLRD